MKAKITHMWGDWNYYYAGSLFQCRDETDKSAYEALLGWPDEKCVLMGKVLVERIK